MISRLFVLPLILFAIKTNADLAWESPAAGDVYTPGDTLQAVWTSTDNVISPSFTICAADNGTDLNDAADCGTAVWPSVSQNGTEYSISLVVPNITGNGDYYLVMKDDRGTTYDTPDFSLAFTNTTPDANATSSLVPTSPTTSITYPLHSASTVAAIAVPLSLLAATLLVALLLFFFRIRQSRKRKRERKEARASEKSGSQQSAISFASAADIERAVLALAAVRGYGGQGPHICGPPQPPVGANVPPPFGTPSLGATVAALLGMGAFSGWAHGIVQPPPGIAATHDTYTHEPVPRYAVGSDIASANQQHPIHAAPTPMDPRVSPSHHEGAHYNQKTAHASSQWSGRERPQLPEIQLNASSPPPHSKDSPPPPPPPPKQLFPGSSPGNAMLSYDGLYAFAPKPPGNTSADLSPSREGDSHASLSVISDYTQASPALPQGGSDLVPPVSDRFPTLRVLQPSLTRMRSLRRLETIPESGKQLPTRPEDRFGTQLYEAVSRAVGK